MTMREMFESSVERLLADASTPEVALQAEAGAWPAALWQAVEDSGFALAAVPEDAGGASASWHDVYVVLRACGRRHAPVPLPEAVLANWLLGRSGLEPVAGPLSFAAASTLRIDATGRATGRLDGVPWGRHVGHVVAVADGEHGKASVVLLAASAAARRVLRTNVAGEPRDDLDFEGAAVVAAAPLPAGTPRDVLLHGGALLRAAQTAGALHVVLDLTTRYATERVQFGKPIGGFQAVQHQIAVLAEHVGAAAVAAEAACAESGADAFALLPVAAAKVCAAEAAGVAAAVAHAVHGAIGFTHEHVLHLSTRRLWAWRSEYGSLAHWSRVIGEAVCAGGSADLWPMLTRGSFLPAAATTGDTP